MKKKVLLVSMPFGAVERPTLGLSLLKARLAETGIACDVSYLNFSFAELIGVDTYQWLMYDLPYTAFAGDWSFTEALYGERTEIDGRYVQKVLRETWELSETDIRRIEWIRSLTKPFLDYCLSAIRWDDYALVGFTSTFEQNIASLALTRLLKAVHPDISIVFGGANWEAEMGQELHRQFSFVDYVCSGEAEESLPALARSVLSKKATTKTLATIPGLVYRANGEESEAGESISTGPAIQVRDMDALPFPDFSDYFRTLDQSTGSSAVVPTLLFETSRGCWWGAKSHCTFCGLNGGSMAFRSKSAARALDELGYLVDKWKVEMVEAVDNILDMKYFAEFLPGLIEQRRGLQIFYEVKANLSRDQVRMLRDAGVNRIQPGVESMSDHVLKLMRKGTTALKNIQLLKWCQEYNVGMEWNILYGFPGETREDYSEMLELLREIRFLKPPVACGPVRMDRFSPYFNTPSEFGLCNVRPLSTYEYLYPFPDESLRRIAYYYDYDYEAGVDPKGFAAEVMDYVAEWRKNPETGRLCSTIRPDGDMVLIDTRSNALLPELKLSGLDREIYEYCDEARSASGVAKHLREFFPDSVVTEQQVLELLDSLVANRLMVKSGKQYLSLAVSITPIRISDGHIRSRPERKQRSLELPVLQLETVA